MGGVVNQVQKQISEDYKHTLFLPIIFGLLVPPFIIAMANENEIGFISFIGMTILWAYVLFTYGYLRCLGVFKVSVDRAVKGLLVAMVILLFQMLIMFLTKAQGGVGQFRGLHLNILLPVACLIGPAWEETIFRYAINIKFFKGGFKGVCVSSALFAVAHGSTRLVDLLVYFGMGFLLCLANRGREDIFASVLAHSIINVVAVLAFVE